MAFGFLETPSLVVSAVGRVTPRTEINVRVGAKVYVTKRPVINVCRLQVGSGAWRIRVVVLVTAEIGVENCHVGPGRSRKAMEAPGEVFAFVPA